MSKPGLLSRCGGDKAAVLDLVEATARELADPEGRVLLCDVARKLGVASVKTQVHELRQQNRWPFTSESHAQRAARVHFSAHPAPRRRTRDACASLEEWRRIAALRIHPPGTILR